MTIRKIISTDKAPSAIGPYVQANLVGETLYTSGQIALDPALGAKGGLIGDTAEKQADRVLKNLGAILSEVGYGYENVVKTTVFLSSMEDFASVNEVYAKYFKGEILPSRSAIAVSSLPMGALVEIEAIAVKCNVLEKSFNEKLA